MIAAVLERLVQRKLIAINPIDVSKTGMMLINNAASLLLMVPLLFWFGEHDKWYRFRSLNRTGMTLLVASCVNAVAISWAGINAQGYVTATTFMARRLARPICTFTLAAARLAPHTRTMGWTVRARMHEMSSSWRLLCSRAGVDQPQQICGHRFWHGVPERSTHVAGVRGMRHRVVWRVVVCADTLAADRTAQGSAGACVPRRWRQVSESAGHPLLASSTRSNLGT
mmetsp:Transcript_55719/g.153285  ORF Transcript_55719/g.153285 Transcript_55719/m.153285 type:complete len:226 (-) Transcript_55719:456-1133(-)